MLIADSVTRNEHLFLLLYVLEELKVSQMDTQLLKLFTCHKLYSSKKKKKIRALLTQGFLIYLVKFWNLKMQYYL